MFILSYVILFVTIIFFVITSVEFAQVSQTGRDSRYQAEKERFVYIKMYYEVIHDLFTDSGAI